MLVFTVATMRAVREPSRGSESSALGWASRGSLCDFFRRWGIFDGVDFGCGAASGYLEL